MSVHKYTTKFIELSRFALYLLLDEERKAHKFEEGLKYRVYDRVVRFQINNFSKLGTMQR